MTIKQPDQRTSVVGRFWRAAKSVAQAVGRALTKVAVDYVAPIAAAVGFSAYTVMKKSSELIYVLFSRPSDPVTFTDGGHIIIRKEQASR